MLLNLQHQRFSAGKFTPQALKLITQNHRYDDLATRRALETQLPNFRWCLGPGCTFGQEHPDLHAKNQPQATCSSCGFVSCAFHNVPWHAGQTCEQYAEQVVENPTEEDRKTEKIIRRLAKRCPGCKRYINKNGGCQHMTCRFRILI